jgi:hypothetical protein
VINGGNRVPETAPTASGAETPKLNGQTRKSLRQQQISRDNRETVRQKSLNVRQSIDEYVGESNDRTALQKQNSNKFGNVLSRQQSQQQQQNLQLQPRFISF